MIDIEVDLLLYSAGEDSTLLLHMLLQEETINHLHVFNVGGSSMLGSNRELEMMTAIREHISSSDYDIKRWGSIDFTRLNNLTVYKSSHILNYKPLPTHYITLLMSVAKKNSRIYVGYNKDDENNDIFINELERVLGIYNETYCTDITLHAPLLEYTKSDIREILESNGLLKFTYECGYEDDTAPNTPISNYEHVTAVVRRTKKGFSYITIDGETGELEIFSTKELYRRIVFESNCIHYSSHAIVIELDTVPYVLYCNGALDVFNDSLSDYTIVYKTLSAISSGDGKYLMDYRQNGNHIKLLFIDKTIENLYVNDTIDPSVINRVLLNTDRYL